jgi:hypothetical protein
MLFLKKEVINLFININKIYEYMLNDNFLYFYNKSNYIEFLNELYNILITTLSKIEKIYYKYFLFPKLQNRVK